MEGWGEGNAVVGKGVGESGEKIENGTAAYGGRRNGGNDEDWGNW